MEPQKGKTLFDHINHISKYQDPDYFTSLTDLDKKTFNHFMILRGLSMNPKYVDDIAFVFRYFDAIPSPQFYKILISLLPAERSNSFHPWIKSAKKIKYSKTLVDFFSKRFESSEKESIEYIELLDLTEAGKKEIRKICMGFGKNDKEIDKILSNDE